jgi:hypothetical protein
MIRLTCLFLVSWIDLVTLRPVRFGESTLYVSSFYSIRRRPWLDARPPDAFKQGALLRKKRFHRVSVHGVGAGRDAETAREIGVGQCLHDALRDCRWMA